MLEVVYRGLEINLGKWRHASGRLFSFSLWCDVKSQPSQAWLARFVCLSSRSIRILNAQQQSTRDSCLLPSRNTTLIVVVTNILFVVFERVLFNIQINKRLTPISQGSINVTVFNYCSILDYQLKFTHALITANTVNIKLFATKPSCLKFVF